MAHITLVNVKCGSTATSQLLERPLTDFIKKSAIWCPHFYLKYLKESFTQHKSIGNQSFKAKCVHVTTVSLHFKKENKIEEISSLL